MEFDARGRPVRALGTVHDITERRLLEAQLRQAQKMEVVGRLVGGVAHDFNSLLSIIILQRDQAETSLPSPAEREAVREIRQAAERAADLVRQLLLFSRRQIMQPRPTELNQLISSLARMLQRFLGETITLQLHLAPSPLWLYADSAMLDQVVLNLAVNAPDAMPRGGRLEIATAPVELPPRNPPCSTRRPAPLVLSSLTVCDSGVGIPPELLPHIFEPFFTTKAPRQGDRTRAGHRFRRCKTAPGLGPSHQPGQPRQQFDLFLPREEV